MIRYGSVCSGVEAASLAWEPLGWTPAWFSEIDSVACGVLAYHWPDVPNLGDMLELDAEQCADIDVLVGGTPCQSFSVAGLRKGLDDERGNLTLSFVRLAEAIDAIRRERGQPPVTIVWENVPGVFSDSDNAFGCFLGALAGEDDPLEPPGEGWSNAGCVLGPERVIAWRILNAQFFGVPQRRRRVFVVASAREGFDPREVLFECEGVRGDPQASGEARKEAPGYVVPSLVASGRGVERAGDSRGQDPVIPVLEAGARTGKSTTDKRAGIGIGKPGDPMYTLQAGKQHAVAVAMRGRNGGATCEMGGDVANALRSADGGGSKPFVLAETCPTLCASGKAAGSATQQDAESGALIPTVASTIRAADGHHGHSSPCGDGCDNLICTAQNTGQGYWKESSVGATLRCCGKGGESRNANLAVIAFSSKDNGGDATQDISPTLRAAGHDKSHANAGAPPAVCINARQDPITTREITGPLDVFGNSHGVTTGFRVRRLLPVECELLQGMPPGHTARTPDKELADGPRYKLIGNSMAVPVMRWIGRRIQAAEKNSK